MGHVLGVDLQGARAGAGHGLVQRLEGVGGADQPAACQLERLGIGAVERAIGGDRGGGDAASDVLAGLGHHVAAAGRGIGAAGHRGGRQVGVADLDLDALDGQAQRPGGGQGQGGADAVADFVGGALHLGRAAGPQGDPRARRRHLGRIEGRGAAPADQPVALAHGAGPGIAASPAEGFGALAEALGQMPAGVGQALDGLALRVVLQAQLDRIHGQGVGQLVHRALQREDVRRLGRGAHEARGVAVGVHDADLGGHVRAGIEPGRGVGAGDHVVVRPAGELGAFVDQGGELAVPLGGQPDVMLGGSPIGGDGEALGAAGCQLDRPVHPLGRQRDQGRALGQRSARAERAADVGRDEVHIVGRDAELLGHARLGPPDVLARLPDGQLAARPGAGGGEQLDRIVVLGGRGIARVDLDRRLGEGCSGVALLLRFTLGGFLRDARAVEAGARRLRVIIGLDLVRRLSSRLESVGQDHGDDLAVVPNLVALQSGRGSRPTAERLRRLRLTADIVVSEDIEHAGDRPRRLQLERLDPAARDRAGHEPGEGRMRDRFIGGVARRAGHLGRAIDAGDGFAEQ